MTPEKIPFYSATYIPLDDNYGMVGFKKLLQIIAKNYKRDRETLIKKGKEVLSFLSPKSKIKATKIDKNILISKVISQIKSNYNRESGGFGGAPKFPKVSTLILTLNLYSLTKDVELLEIVKNSIDKMSMGGFYDLIDGGYCRYATDDIWLTPHFEKMVYDNGLMVELLVEIYNKTSQKRYLRLAEDTANFLLSKMYRDGLFFSASDADSNGVEGEYFLFEYEKVLEEFEKNGIKDAKNIAEKLSITENGNFNGLSIVRLKSWEDFDKFEIEIEKALKILKKIRDKKEYPNIDKKILTSWNAIVIKSLFKLARVERKYLQIAKESLNSLRDYASKGDKLYHSGLIGHKPNIDGFLEDYAYLSSTMIEAYKTTLDNYYLKFAQDLLNGAVKRFYRGGKWSISDGEFKDFADDIDSSYPSEVGVLADTILSLKNLQSSIYEKFLFSTLEAYSYDLMRQPMVRAKLTQVAIRYFEDDKIVKSNRENLEPLIYKIDSLNYPWIFLKVDNNLEKEFLVCDSKACFADFNSVDEVLEFFERV